MYSECLFDVASPLVQHVLACYMPCALSVVGHVLVRVLTVGRLGHCSLWHVPIPLVECGHKMYLL